MELQISARQAMGVTPNVDKSQQKAREVVKTTYLVDILYRWPLQEGHLAHRKTCSNYPKKFILEDSSQF